MTIPKIHHLYRQKWQDICRKNEAGARN